MIVQSEEKLKYVEIQRDPLKRKIKKRRSGLNLHFAPSSFMVSLQNLERNRKKYSYVENLLIISITPRQQYNFEILYKIVNRIRQERGVSLQFLWLVNGNRSSQIIEYEKPYRMVYGAMFRSYAELPLPYMLYEAITYAKTFTKFKNVIFMKGSSVFPSSSRLAENAYELKFLENLLEILAQDSTAGLVVPCWKEGIGYPAQQDLQGYTLPASVKEIRFGSNPLPPIKYSRIYQADLSCFAIRRDVLEQVGYPDIRMEEGGATIDFLLRLRKKFYKIYRCNTVRMEIAKDIERKFHWTPLLSPTGNDQIILEKTYGDWKAEFFNVHPYDDFFPQPIFGPKHIA